MSSARPDATERRVIIRRARNLSEGAARRLQDAMLEKEEQREENEPM
jgi:hypothetical protein